MAREDGGEGGWLDLVATMEFGLLRLVLWLGSAWFMILIYLLTSPLFRFIPIVGEHVVVERSALRSLFLSFARLQS